jgi:transposase-like protein
MTLMSKDTTVESVIELLISHGLDGMAQAMECLLNEAMKIERSKFLQVQPYERSELRQDYANGYKPKQLKTRVGALDLSIPQVRSSEFYPSVLERGIRSERALRVSIAEMYLQGVSTRKVKEMKSAVAIDIRSIFNAPDEKEALRLLNIYAEKYQSTAPKLGQWMRENIQEGLTVMSFPEPHRKRLRTSNMAERVNQSIRTRTKVARLL